MASSHFFSKPLNLGKAFRSSPGPIHYLFAFVFLIRIIALARLTSSPILLPSGSDMHFYDEWAKQILHGRLTDHFAFYGLPLYAYLLAFLYKIFGYSPFVPGFFQASLDAGTAILIYKITVRILRGAEPAQSRFFSDLSAWTGLAAAVGWAFFVPAQAYSVILMPTSCFVFVFWLLVWQIAKTDRAPSAWRSLIFGILIGITAMGVATILFLVPLILAALVSRPQMETVRSSARARLAAITLLFVGLGAGTSPCWLHNYFIARDPVFLSAHGGINLWLGNNPEATGYPRFPGFHAGQAAMLRDSIDLLEAATGRTLKRSEVSRYWSSKARAYIAQNPGAWLKLMARKIGNFWNGFEYDDLGVITNLREHGVLFPGPHFAIVAALGIVGLFFAWRTFPASRWVGGAMLLEMSAVLPTFVTERYRLAAVPGLLVFAALGLHQLWTHWLLGRYRNAALYLALLGAAVIFVSMPRHDPALWAMEAYNSGRLALETNNLPEAKQHLERAHAYVPDNAEINFALGNLRLAERDPAGAKVFYHAALKADGAHKGALNNLGVLALNENQPSPAADYFRRALVLEPRNAKAHYLLAKALAALGDHAAAHLEAARAVELDPAQPEYKALVEQLSVASKP
jgi:tetratricopeptide (TPR) repeat protein